MGIFTKKSSEEAVSTSAEKVAISSIIGNGMTILGDLSFAGKLRLDGKVKGNIKGEHLILGETGEVTGDIDTESCSLQGKVNGNIKARNMNVIKGCRIEGNVSAVNLSVESGAALNGEIKVDEKDLRLLKKSTQSKIESHAGKPVENAANL